MSECDNPVGKLIEISKKSRSLPPEYKFDKITIENDDEMNLCEAKFQSFEVSVFGQSKKNMLLKTFYMMYIS